MLDDREQSILRDIERHLEQTDRRLVRRGRRETDRRTYWFSVAALIAGVVLGMALAALGPVGHGLLLILVSAVGTAHLPTRSGDRTSSTARPSPAFRRPEQGNLSW